MTTLIRLSPSKTIPNRIVDQSVDQLLYRFSGEFIENDLEERFLHDTWSDHKKVPQYALLIGGAVILAFGFTDWLTSASWRELLMLLSIRLLTGLFLLGSAEYIRRAPAYFPSFHRLCLLCQLVAAMGLIGLGTLKGLPFIHNALHLFMVTLIYYQFLQNRFTYTLVASGFFTLAYCAVNAGLYSLAPVDMIRFLLYLGLANGLGIAMLSALNHTRRKAHIQQLKSTHANQQLAATVDQLRQVRKEVKTLTGLLPICAKCKQIRDDNGYWSQLETYLHQHAQLRFSHSICPACAQELYPNFKSNRKD